MPRHQLSDLHIRRTKPASKPRKLFDGAGLFLLVHPNGSRYWRMKYRHAGKERLLALGVYPQVGLADARAQADEAKRLIAAGMDPVHERRVRRASAVAESAQTFKVLAEEWIASRAGAWSPSYTETVRSATPDRPVDPSDHARGIFGTAPAVDRAGPVLFPLDPRLGIGGLRGLGSG